MEEILITFGTVIYFVLAVTVLITFFAIAARLKHIKDSSKRIESMIEARAVHDNLFTKKHCSQCQESQLFYTVPEGDKCLDCGFLITKKEYPSENSNNPTDK